MLTKTQLFAVSAASLLISFSAPASAAKNVCGHSCPNSFTTALTHSSGHSGGHSITAVGSVVGTLENGTHGTVLDVSHEAPAVPEPKTWATILLGFGILGFSMRRKRRNSGSLTQSA